MRKISTMSALGLILGILASPVMGQQDSYHISGGELLDYCKDTAAMMEKKAYNVSKSSWCIGFVQGAVTSHRFYSAFYAVQNPQNKNLSNEALGKKVEENQVFCVPTSVTLGQVVKDVVSFLEANPSYQKEQASMAVARALYKTYPCK